MSEREVFLNADGVESREQLFEMENYTNEQLKAEVASEYDGTIGRLNVTLTGDHAGAFDLEAFVDELEDEFDVEITVAQDELNETA